MYIVNTLCINNNKKRNGTYNFTETSFCHSARVYDGYLGNPFFGLLYMYDQ